MAINRQVVTKVDNFDRAQSYTTTPAGDFGWTIADTSSSGTPTYLNLTEDGGAAKLLLVSTGEVENVCLYQNDVLPYDWAKIQYVEWTIKLTTALVSNDTVFWGVSSARNDAVASLSEAFVFKMVAATSTSAVVIDTKDGTTAVTDTAAGSQSTVYKKYTIDFSNGLSDVRAFVDGSRVATGTTFNLSAITAGNNCQLIAQLYKASGTTVPGLQITRVAIQYRTSDGA